MEVISLCIGIPLYSIGSYRILRGFQRHISINSSPAKSIIENPKIVRGQVYRLDDTKLVQAPVGWIMNPVRFYSNIYDNHISTTYKKGAYVTSHVPYGYIYGKKFVICESREALADQVYNLQSRFGLLFVIIGIVFVYYKELLRLSNIKMTN